MNYRMIAVSMALSLSLATAPTLMAAPGSLHLPMHAKVGNDGTMISFQVRNNSQAPLMIQAGDKQVNIEAGKVASFKLAPGTQLTSVSATANHPAGGVLVTVDSNLKNNTVVIN